MAVNQPLASPAPTLVATTGAPTTVPLAAREDLPDATPGIRTASRWIVLGFLLAAAVSALVAFVVRGQEARARDAAVLALTFLSVGVGLLLLHVLDLRGKRYGVFRPLVGADHRFSTSLTQIGLWTVLVATVLAYLLFRSVVAGATLAAVLPSDRWDEYLLLLGGPFAAAIVSKGVVTSKLANGTLQKSEPSRTTLSQVATDDSGGGDLVDAQYLLLNLVAQVYVLVAVLRTGVLPALPDVLLALTSLTAATYVGNKIAQRNAPTITSVTPRAVTAGTVVTVLGDHFDPNGTVDDRIVTVQVSGLAQTIEVAKPDFTNTVVRFRAPDALAGLALGPHDLRVVSSAGVETAATPVEVVAPT